jgi:sporulation integral membrane protein YtvI
VSISLNLNYLYSALRFLFVIAAIVFGLLALYYISTVTYPFIIALVLSFLINPIVNFFEARGRMPRALAVLFALLLIIGSIVGILTFLITEIVGGVAYLANVLPEHVNELVRYLEEFFAAQIIPLYNQLASMFNNLDPSQKSSVIENIQSVGTTVTSVFTDFVQNIASAISRFIVSLPNFATVIIFSLLATFFISKDWYKLGSTFKRLIPNKAFESGGKVYKDLRKALFGFIKAQFTLISVTAVIVLVGLLIMRVEYAITIALLIGLVDILPYLGTGAVFVPWIVYSLLTENFYLSIGLSILYGIVIVVRQVMEPKVLSSNIGLDPLATLIALFVGFKLFGFLGLIIGPVLLVVIKTLHQANIFREAWTFIIDKK